MTPAANFIGKDRAAAVFDRRIPPVLTIDPGAVVTFETGDVAYERMYRGESPDKISDGEFNMVTGPVCVRSAEPGDALRIDVLDVTIQRAWGVWIPDYGGLGEHTTTLQVKPLALRDGRIHISQRLSVPVEPMIGCIGLAPAKGRASTLEPAYAFGGNMDLRELSPGASLYLPVQTSGGLLSLGDLHAAMGTGEPAWISIEAAGQATVRIGVEKGRQLPSPRLRVGANTICVVALGKKGTWDEAYQQALDQAYELLREEHHLDAFEAYAYACARVSMRFGGPASAIVLAVVPDPW